jgi:hypothetical protein
VARAGSRTEGPWELVVTDLIVAESVTIVGERGGGKAGRTLYEYIVDECDASSSLTRVCRRAVMASS